MKFLQHVFIAIFAASSIGTNCTEIKGRISCMVKKLFSRVDRVVEGDVFRVPTGIYEGYETNNPWYELKKGENEPFINVWVTTSGYPDTLIIHLSKEEREDKEGSCNWADHGHPRLHKFPSYLPLYLFVNENGELKKEGDKTVIYHHNPKTHERIKIILTLRQGNYRYRESGDGKFDQSIRDSKDYEKVVEPYLENLHSNLENMHTKKSYKISKEILNHIFNI